MLTTATPETPTFPELLTEAMRGPRFRSSRQHALDHGVDEMALTRYAGGAVSASERAEIQNVLTSCDWAMKFVIDLVKSRRRKRSAA